MAGLLRATSVVAAFTLVSRVSGFVRDMLIAQWFGASVGMDAFLVAFKIPNFMRRLFAEGAFSQAFVPVLAEYQKRHTREELLDFVAHVLGCLGFILLILTLVAILGSPWVVRLFAPGFSTGDARFVLATDMLRVTFPYLMLISLTAFCGGILNSNQKFGLSAIAPVSLNICLIIAAWFGNRYMQIPIKALAWGVLISGILQWGLLWGGIKRLGMAVWPIVSFQHTGVNKMLKLMVPTLIGSSVSQINLLLDTMFASFLPVGSVSWLYYSDRLVWFPLGIFGVAIATVILPYLSKAHHEDPKKFSMTMDWAIRCDLLIGLPAAVGLGVLAEPLFATLFQYGKFGAHDVMMAAYSLRAFALGLQAFMLVKVITSAFYARQDTKTPVRVAIVSVIANFLMNLIFIRIFAHAGLALSISLSSWINVLALWYLLHRQKIYQPTPGWGLFLLKLLIANTLLGVALWYLKGDISIWLHDQFLHKVFRLSELMLVAFMVYAGALWALRIPLNKILRPEV